MIMEYRENLKENLLPLKQWGCFLKVDFSDELHIYYVYAHSKKKEPHVI